MPYIMWMNYILQGANICFRWKTVAIFMLRPLCNRRYRPHYSRYRKRCAFQN